MTIGYIDAWRAWFSGQEVDPQARLWFMSLLWWGRAGKIAAFLGGATVLLDLIGPERLRRYGRKYQSEESRWLFSFQAAQAIGGFGTFGALLAILYYIVQGGRSYWVVAAIFVATLTLLALFTWVIDKIPDAVASVLDTEHPAQVLRHVAVVLFIVGFHFDLLAS